MPSFHSNAIACVACVAFEWKQGFSLHAYDVGLLFRSSDMQAILRYEPRRSQSAVARCMQMSPRCPDKKVNEYTNTILRSRIIILTYKVMF